LGKILKITSPNFWATFYRGKSNTLVMAKMGWATFLGFFQKTHLVTLHVEER
jgi:hypothetical protein